MQIKKTHSNKDISLYEKTQCSNTWPIILQHTRQWTFRFPKAANTVKIPQPQNELSGISWEDSNKRNIVKESEGVTGAVWCLSCDVFSPALPCAVDSLLDEVLQRWISQASQQVTVTGGWVEAVYRSEQGAGSVTGGSIPASLRLIHWLITYTHAHTLKKIHVPDKSIDLFLFWGSLGFFTGGLRFGGFSTLLGLSLSVPECSEDKEHRLTVRYGHFGHVNTNYQQKCRVKKNSVERTNCTCITRHGFSVPLGFHWCLKSWTFFTWTWA